MKRIVGLILVSCLFNGSRASAVQDQAAASRALGFLRANFDKIRLNSGSPFGHATFAIGGLAMLACGVSPDDPQVQKAAGAVEAFVNKTYEDASKDKFQSNWILAYGGLLFAEMAARGKRNEATMKKIVALLEDHQTKDGGWGHQKAPTTLIKGYPDTFFAPTNWCAAALGALRRQGIAVNPQTIDRVVKLFETGQASDGGYEYDPFRDKKRGEAGRTGAAVFAMALLDRKESPAFARAVEFLKSNIAQVPDGHSSPPMHIMSAALAMAAVGDTNAFTGSLGRQIQAAQENDGSFKKVVGEKTKKQEERRDKGGERASGKDDPIFVTAYHLVALKASGLKLLASKPGRK